MSKDLRSFLAQVKEADAKGLLQETGYVEVGRRINPHLEIALLREKLAHEGRFPVIFCPEVEGSTMPIVLNLDVSRELHGLSLGLDPSRWTDRDLQREYKKRLDERKPTKRVPASRAPVKEVIIKGADVDLARLPIPQSAVPQAGKYITPGCMICRDPETGTLNVGVYRHQVKGKNLLGAMINPLHDAAPIAWRYAQMGKPMEVAIVLGHHPAVGTAALARGSLGDFSELDVAGGILGEPLEVVQGETVELDVPAAAEIIIEGVIDDPRPSSTDGPFPEWTHYGRGNKPAYLIRVTAITMRHDAIYHDLVTTDRGRGGWGGYNTIRTFNAVKLAVPTVRQIRLWLGITWVQITKRVEGEGKLAAFAAMTAEEHNQIIVVVDDDIDLWSERDLGLALSRRLVGDRGIDIISRITSDHLNPTSYNENRDPGIELGPMGSRVLIDATRPLNLQWHTRITPENRFESLWDTMTLDDFKLSRPARQAREAVAAGNRGGRR
ncbi:MAG: UbiD family decarboxylase [Chloroflexi bacterium]|nr:UbiD family decarboxylase [Chloroflexota bacterium]